MEVRGQEGSYHLTIARKISLQGVKVGNEKVFIRKLKNSFRSKITHTLE
jgi:hypothetical protein